LLIYFINKQAVATSYFYSQNKNKNKGALARGVAILANLAKGKWLLRYSLRGGLVLCWLRSNTTSQHPFYSYFKISACRRQVAYVREKRLD
jgi:hypothetical protein